MSEFIKHMHYRLGFKMGKPDGLSRHWGEEKSPVDAHFFNERQLRDLKYDDVGEDEHTKDMELEGIDMATWEKKNRVQVVS